MVKVLNNSPSVDKALNSMIPHYPNYIKYKPTSNGNFKRKVYLTSDKWFRSKRSQENKQQLFGLMFLIIKTKTSRAFVRIISSNNVGKSFSLFSNFLNSSLGQEGYKTTFTPLKISSSILNKNKNINVSFNWTYPLLLAWSF